jgi:hypothetical protein
MVQGMTGWGACACIFSRVGDEQRRERIMRCDSRIRLVRLGE